MGALNLEDVKSGDEAFGSIFSEMKQPKQVTNALKDIPASSDQEKVIYEDEAEEIRNQKEGEDAAGKLDELNRAKYSKGAKFITDMGDLIIPNAAGMLLKREPAEFKADPEELNDIEKAWYLILEFYDYDFKGSPVIQIVIVMVLVYGLPIYGAIQENKKAKKEAAKSTGENNIFSAPETAQKRPQNQPVQQNVHRPANTELELLRRNVSDLSERLRKAENTTKAETFDIANVTENGQPVGGKIIQMYPPEPIKKDITNEFFEHGKKAAEKAAKEAENEAQNTEVDSSFKEPVNLTNNSDASTEKAANSAEEEKPAIEEPAKEKPVEQVENSANSTEAAKDNQTPELKPCINPDCKEMHSNKKYCSKHCSAKHTNLLRKNK